MMHMNNLVSGKPPCVECGFSGQGMKCSESNQAATLAVYMCPLYLPQLHFHISHKATEAQWCD